MFNENGPSPEEMGLGNKELNKEYKETATVEGKEISVGFDEGYGDYTIYFPQLDINADRGVLDQVIRISDDPEDAKKVFDFAVEQAGIDEESIRDLYKKVERFIKENIS